MLKKGVGLRCIPRFFSQPTKKKETVEKVPPPFLRITRTKACSKFLS